MKEKFKSLISKIKDGIKNFPITLVLIAICTIYYVIFNEIKFKGIFEINNIMSFFIISIFGVFLIEAFILKKEKKSTILRIVGTIISMAISIGLVYILEKELLIDIGYIITGYIFTLFLVAMYMICKASDMKFNKFVLHIFNNVFLLTIVFIILSIGTSAIVSIFNSLIFKLRYNIYTNIYILILGLFYIPSLIITLPIKDKEKEVNKFMKVFCLYVLLPLFLIVVSIIYIYIFKILVTNEMPVGMIFPLTACIFSFGFVLWNLIGSYSEENKFARVISNIFKYLFIPFILLQIYTVYIRFSEYGITPSRYITYMFILAEIIVNFFMIYKKGEKVQNSLIPLAAIVLISTIGPLNASYMSKLNQKAIMMNIINKNNLYENNEFNIEKASKEDAQKLKSAYKYLKDYEDSNKYIPEYITADSLKNINTYNDRGDVEEESKYYSFYNYDKEIDIKEYSKMVDVSKSDYKIVSNYSEALKQEEICIPNIEEYLIKIIKKDKENNQSYNKYAQGLTLEQEDCLVKIDEICDVYITSITFRHYESENKFENIKISGYLLYK